MLHFTPALLWGLMGRVMGDNPFSIVATHHGEIHRYLARVTSRGATRTSLAGDVSASVPCPSDLARRRQCASVALHHRHESLPESCSGRSEAPSRDGRGEHRRARERSGMARERGAVQGDERADRPHRGRAAVQATRGVHDAEDASSVRRYREALTCSAESARARLSGAQKVAEGWMINGVSRSQRDGVAHNRRVVRWKPGLVATGVGGQRRGPSGGGGARGGTARNAATSCPDIGRWPRRRSAAGASACRGSLAGAGRAGIAAGRSAAAAPRSASSRRPVGPILIARSTGCVDGGIPRIARGRRVSPGAPGRRAPSRTRRRRARSTRTFSTISRDGGRGSAGRSICVSRRATSSVACCG